MSRRMRVLRMARRSSSVVPPQMPAGMASPSAQARHGVRAGHARQIRLASGVTGVGRPRAGGRGVAGRPAQPRQVVFHHPSRAVRVAGFQLAEQVRLCLPARWGGIRTLTALRTRLQCPGRAADVPRACAAIEVSAVRAPVARVSGRLAAAPTGNLLKEESGFRRFRLPGSACWRRRLRRGAGGGRLPRAWGRTGTGAS
jgi:hypothetical protein